MTQQPHNHNAVIERTITALQRTLYVFSNGKTTGFYVDENAQGALDTARPIIEALTDGLVGIMGSVADHGSGLNEIERQGIRDAVNEAVEEAMACIDEIDAGVDPADTRADWLHDCRDQN